MSVSKFISEIKSKKKISPKIRLYLIDKDKHYFLNEGVLKNGFNCYYNHTLNSILEVKSLPEVQ